MIQATPQMRILVCVQPADFRKGIDGLCRVCREALGRDPFSGSMFVFRNRRATAIKILVYDGQGFWLCQKRLSKGTFRWWVESATDRSRELESYQLPVLLSGGDPRRARGAPAWRRVDGGEKK
jgi:transposase